MNPLIKLTENNGQTVVSARDLYDFLKPQTVFPNWIARCLDYGFIKDVDYHRISNLESGPVHLGGANKVNYILTIDCAKEIAMIQKTDKGKEARQYFIKCEKRLEAIKLAALKKVQPSEDEIILQSQQILMKRIDTIKMQLVYANETIAAQAPKVEYHDKVLDSSSGLTATQLAKELGFKSAIAFNKKLKAMKVQYQVNKCWVLYAKYAGNDYTVNHTIPYLDSRNVMQTKLEMRWTEKGRQFLHELLGPNYQLTA